MTTVSPVQVSNQTITRKITLTDTWPQTTVYYSLTDGNRQVNKQRKQRIVKLQRAGKNRPLVSRDDGRSNLRCSLCSFAQRNGTAAVSRDIHVHGRIESIQRIIEAFHRLLNVLFKPLHSKRLQRHREPEHAAADPSLASAFRPLSILLAWHVHALLHHVLQTFTPQQITKRRLENATRLSGVQKALRQK